MIEKEIKKYPRTKESKAHHYRINMSKKNYEELGKKICILSPDEYNKLQEKIKKLEKTEIIKKTIINKIEGTKEQEKLIKSIEDLLKSWENYRNKY